MTKALLMPLLNEFVFPMVFISLFFGLAAWWPLEEPVSPRVGTHGPSPMQNTSIATDERPLAGGMLVVK